jgi:hypothetical protein
LTVWRIGPLASLTIARRRSSSFSFISLMMWKRSNTMAASGRCSITAVQYAALMSMATAWIFARLARKARQNGLKASPPRPWATQTICPVSKSMTSV